MIIIESETDRAAKDTTGVIHLSNNNRQLRKDDSHQGKEPVKDVPVHGEDTVPMRKRRRRPKQ
jgi:hypothetical protein